MIKKIIKKTVGVERIVKILKFESLVSNYWGDLKLFYKHSNVFKIDNSKKIEAKLILDYHSVEKGMLFENMKPAFAKARIERLHKNLQHFKAPISPSQTQVFVTYQIMCKYYELHQEKGFDISSFFTHNQYLSYKKSLSSNYDCGFNGAINYNHDSFYKDINEPFEVFAHTRKSVRSFTGEIIELEAINKAIELAATSPSVCNRQASKVYLLQDKEQIDNVLSIQGGLVGYSKNVNQLLILTNDRNYYYTVGERNQLYIDGGLFLMNLLYSLHYYKIANCPIHWGKLIKEEKQLEKFIQIPEAEKIICMIPIGIAKDNFNVTLSKRRGVEEILTVL